MIDLTLPIDDVRFAVVDCETTGGTSGEHRIMEIGVCVVEDGMIMQRHSSLINPHQTIPDFIQLMTGITTAMVADAPEEDEALAPLTQIFADERTVFVAHNVGFDWKFVSASMQRIGEPLGDVAQLCTCKLSRRISSGLKRHDLGSVADHYGVNITERHRALGDAEATAQALLGMIEIARNEHEAQTLGDLIALQYAPRTKPGKETKARTLLEPYLRELPDEPGVYYFLGAKKNLLYVGKAKSLQRRVNSYFNAAPLHGRKVTRMIRYIKHITWETTGTELGAMLLESREIKTRRPSYNSAGTEYHAPTFLRLTNDTYPVLELVDRIVDDGSEYYGPFRSERMAERIMTMMVREHKLRTCDGPIRPHPDTKPCFQYHIKRCEAPCAALQTRADYLDAVQRAQEFLGNVERGAIGKLREQMEVHAEALDFERAATLRDGIREIERVTLHAGDRPLAVMETNVIIVIPTSDRYKTVEVFFLRAGRLRFQRVVGTRARLDVLYAAVNEIYFAPFEQQRFTDREIDELKIITSWLYQRREKATVVAIRDHQREVVHDLLAKAIRDCAPPVEDEAPSEYSQIPIFDESAPS